MLFAYSVFGLVCCTLVLVVVCKLVSAWWFGVTRFMVDCVMLVWIWCFWFWGWCSFWLLVVRFGGWYFVVGLELSDFYLFLCVA